MPYYLIMVQVRILFLLPFLLFILSLLPGCSGLPCIPGIPLPMKKEPDRCLQPKIICTEQDLCLRAEAEHRLNDLRCQVEDGNCYAAVLIGDIYMHGGCDCKSVKRDYPRAFCWYRRAAEACIPVAEVQVGHFYRDGIGIEKCLPEARCWYERAAKQGDVTGMLALAESYKGWFGFPKDYDKAVYWYRKAMCLGSLEGEFQLGFLLLQNCNPCKFNKGVELTLKAAEEGNPDALAALGNLYLEGRMGGQCDVKCAITYFERAAKLGSAQGAFSLGMLYSMGTCVRRSDCEAFKWFLMAAERGLPSAEMLVADLYRTGRGIPKNCTLAALWYARAASHGIIAADVSLADLYLAGKGVPRVLEQAAHLFEIASVKGPDPYADLVLSVMYQEGFGVPYSMETSVKYYLRAKNKPGYIYAMYKIGRNYELGSGFHKDLGKAIKWYTWAAEKGLAVAAIQLGDIYYRAGTFDKSADELEIAYNWYRKAAFQGQPYAQYMTGIMLLAGQGVVPDEYEGARFIKKAAYQNAKEAQYQLGLLYLTGEGVPASDVQAYAWLRNALDCVEDAPPTILKEIINHMNLDTRVTAVELARKYHDKFQAQAKTKFPLRVTRISMTP